MNDGIGAVLLHGFTSTTANMQPIADDLAETGIAVDLPLLPGHGTRWEDLAATTAADIQGAALAAYDRLARKCQTVFTVGLSMGGALALWVAAQRETAAVVTINPGLRLRPGTGVAARVLSRLKPTMPAIAGDIAKPGVAEEAYEVTPVRAVPQLDRIFGDAREALTQLVAQQTPVLLLRSPRDNVLGGRSAKVLRDQLAPEQLTEVILRRSQHVATLDYDVELLLRRTRGFIQDHA